MHPLLDTTVVISFAILYPIYGLLVFPKTKLESLLRQNPARTRLRLYLGTIFWEWLLTIFAVFAWFQGNRTLSELGFKMPSGPGFLMAAVLVLATIAYMLWQLQQVIQFEQAREQIRNQVTSYSEILPRTKVELFLFVLVSITAGICEELLYRGFLIPYIEGFSNKGISVLLSSVLFGLSHAYFQGWYGALRTGGIGVFFAGLYIFSGSLWLPMILHAFMDINGARVLRAAYRSPMETAS
jgi:membrane protease YdiL (CAAX protease family)